MNQLKKLYSRFYSILFISVTLIMGVTTGCSDEDEVQQNQYGYVQFKLYKSASYGKNTETRAVNQLELLNDAKKIEVVLQRDGSTLSQTLVLNSYNDENAEFGLRSDKLQLLAGEYFISGYRLFDNLDNLLLSGESEDNTFVVVSGGLTSKALPVEGTARGMVSFKLVKDFIKTRAAD